MFAWAVAVSLVFVLLLIWSCLYRKGLLSWGTPDCGPTCSGSDKSSEPAAGK
jgi:hypothetical protein